MPILEKEVIVIGCGPAGLSAALYLGRANINTIVFGKIKDSQVTKAYMIENYLGFPEGITGIDLLERSFKQIKKYKVPIVEKEVIDIQQKGEFFLVKIENEDVYKTKACIIATGTAIKLSGIDNEESLMNKGVHYCVDCDGPMYQQKKIITVGNGNHAAEEALSCLKYSKNISIISHNEKMECSNILTKELAKHKIPIRVGVIKSFDGTKRLEGLTFMSGEKIKLYAAFMAIGHFSVLDFASKLSLQMRNELLVIDRNGMTSLQGMFAAGNCISECRQIAKSVGDGCNAALSAIKFVRHQNIYQDYGRK